VGKKKAIDLHFMEPNLIPGAYYSLASGEEPERDIGAPLLYLIQ